jgi:hypothetical protein
MIAFHALVFALKPARLVVIKAKHAVIPVAPFSPTGE